jgi:cyanophycinase-like exopeptidase
VAFLPTCAADDGPEAIDHWCNLAREKLSALGASVETPRVIDAASANDRRNVQLIDEADWAYLGGGYPHVAMRILPGTRVMEALNAALARGVLISGSSGGAMLMCARSFVITPELAATIGQFWETGAPDSWNPPLPASLDCLSWIPRSDCAPHFNRRLLPTAWRNGDYLPDGFTLIGIDEETALVSRSNGLWDVCGHGVVTLIRKGQSLAVYQPGQRVALSLSR